jgi:hypothetical protein
MKAAELGTLYHSPVTGQISCVDHAPAWIGDAWRRDHWRSVILPECEAWMWCQVCVTIELTMRTRLVGHADFAALRSPSAGR